MPTLVRHLHRDRGRKNGAAILNRCEGIKRAGPAYPRFECFAFDQLHVQLVWDPPWNQNMISEAGRMKLGMV
jgi:hypothetical protein